MKKIVCILVMFFCAFTVVAQSVQGASREGEPDFLKFDYWLPVDPCVTFYYVDNKIDGFEVSFKIKEGGTQLFRDWVVRLNDGTATFFPFVIEVTLVLNNKVAIFDLANMYSQNAVNTQGVYWDFGREDQCVNQPKAYIDTHLGDTGFDHFGIGILNPYLLQEGKTYKFWIKLKSLGVVDLSKVTGYLRFRLNIDVGKARSLNYWPGDDFEIGDEWWLGYYLPYDNPEDPQDIALKFSFALLDYSAKPKKYGMFSDAIVDLPLTGANCK